MKAVDDALLEWDESFHFKPTKGRVGKLTITRFRVAPPPIKPLRKTGAAAARSRLAKIVRKAPEVMVKVSGGGKGMGRIKAHFDYISRNGDVELENEAGEIIAGKDAVRDLRDEWKYGLYGIPEESRRKEAFNVVLSMPPGTDRQAVKDAARAFAMVEFGGNHQYVFAAHDDELHPHVHLCVKALGIDGTRLNPRKADLQRWRERFAEALREHGIEANATPRLARGARQRTVRQATRHADRSRSRSESSVHAPVAPSKVIKGYAALAKALAQGEPEDRSLALGITRVVSGMVSPPTIVLGKKSRATHHDRAPQSKASSKDRSPER